jgi:hypothetical protein
MPLGIDALHRLNVTFYLHGVNCLNTFYLRSKPNSQSTSLKDETERIISDWKVIIWPVYKLALSNECGMIAAVCTTINPLGVAQTVASYVGENGTIASQSLPSMCASVISLYSAVPGRRTHGRLYVPGVPETESDSGVIGTTQSVRVANIATSLINRWGDNGSSPSVMGGVYSKANGVTRQPGPPPYLTYRTDTHYPWTRAIVNTVIRTQRHRMRGRGI